MNQLVIYHIESDLEARARGGMIAVIHGEAPLAGRNGKRGAVAGAPRKLVRIATLNFQTTRRAESARSS
jgi:hypothetical protein